MRATHSAPHLALIPALLFLACGVSFAPPASADSVFEQAVNAYQRKDYDTARTLFLKTAELGHARSQMNLAVMAMSGQGMAKDAAQALGWIWAARENGQAIDANTLQLLEASVTPSNLGRSQEILAKYGKAGSSSLRRMMVPEKCRNYVHAMSRKIERVNYSPTARKLAQEGVVVIEGVVGTDGLISDLRTVEAIPWGRGSGFETASINAILGSRFEPATLDGVPTADTFRFTFRFNIRDGGYLWDEEKIAAVKKSAALKNPSAMHVMAIMGRLEPTLLVSPETSNELLVEAASAGLADAQAEIGQSFLNLAGCGDENKAEFWLRHAADGAEKLSNLRMAELMMRKPDFKEHIEEIIGYLTRATQHQGDTASDAYILRHVVAIFAASPIAELRDARKALELAKLLNVGATADPQPDEVLASAFAANKDFRGAVRAQEEALRKAEKLSWNTVAAAERLNAYRTEQAWYGNLFERPPVNN